MNNLLIFWKLITSQEVANLGIFLAGIAATLAFLKYRDDRKNRETDDYWSKLKRTFDYIDRLKSFYNNFYFLNISKYIDNIIKREDITELEVTNKNFIKIKGIGATAVVSENLVEIFSLLRELSCVLEKNKYYNLVDEKILNKFIRMYAIQIKNFFVAVNINLGIDRYKSSKPLEGFGNISEEEIRYTRNILDKNFKFLK